MTLYDFCESCVLVNLEDYDNIGIDLEISKVIICLTVVLIITAVIISYLRACIRNLIINLLNFEAYDEESAKTLTELGLNNFGTRFCILSCKILKNKIKRVGQEESPDTDDKKKIKKEKIIFDSAKFYICKDKKYEIKALSDKTSPTLLNTILFCILILLIGACLIIILPGILLSINNLLK